MYKIKVLFFIDGPSPNEEEIKKKLKINARAVGFRNIRFIDSRHSVEDCDAVEGLVPDQYKNKPDFKTAVLNLNKHASSLSENTNIPVSDNPSFVSAPKTTRKAWGSK